MAQKENTIVNEVASLLSKKLNISSVAEVAEALTEQIKFLTVSVKGLDNSILKISQNISDSNIKSEDSNKTLLKLHSSVGDLDKHINKLISKFSESNTKLGNKELSPTLKEIKSEFPVDKIKKFEEKPELNLDSKSKPKALVDDNNNTMDSVLATLKSIEILLQPKQEMQSLKETKSRSTDSKPSNVSDIIKELRPFLVSKQDLQSLQSSSLAKASDTTKKQEIVNTVPKVTSESSNSTKLQSSTSSANKSPEVKQPPEFKSELKPEEKIQKVTIESFSANAIKALKIDQEVTLSQKKLEIIKATNKNIEENFKKILDKIGSPIKEENEEDKGNPVLDAIKDQVLDRVTSGKRKGSKRGPVKGGKGGATGKAKGAATGGAKGAATGGAKGAATGGAKGAATGGAKGAATGGAKGAATSAAKGTAGKAAKAGAKEAAKAGAKAGAKGAAKAGTKALGKGIVKKIPLLGALAGAAFSVDRALQGDFLGAAGELASGVLGSVPIIGTAASTAIDVGLAARDIKKEMAEDTTKEDSFEGNQILTESAESNEQQNNTLPTEIQKKEPTPLPTDFEKREKAIQTAADVEINKNQEVKAAAAQEKLQTLLEKSKTTSLTEDEIKEAKQLAPMVGMPTREVSRILSKNSSKPKELGPPSNTPETPTKAFSGIELGKTLLNAVPVGGLIGSGLSLSNSKQTNEEPSLTKNPETSAKAFPGLELGKSLLNAVPLGGLADSGLSLTNFNQPNQEPLVNKSTTKSFPGLELGNSLLNAVPLGGLASLGSSLIESKQADKQDPSNAGNIGVVENPNEIRPLKAEGEPSTKDPGNGLLNAVTGGGLIKAATVSNQATNEMTKKDFSTMEMFLEKIATNTLVGNQNITNLIAGFNNLTKSLESVLGEKLNVPQVISINKTDNSPAPTSSQYAIQGNTEISNFRTSVVEAGRFRPA